MKNYGIQSRDTHAKSGTTKAAQQQEHNSGGDVGGPEEAPLVAPETLTFVVCVTKSHRAASAPWSCVCTKKG